MTEPEGVNIDGQWFYAPAPVMAVAQDDRLALAIFGGGITPHNRHLVRYSTAPGAVDLTLARSGRCPLLTEHVRALDCLIGMVLGAELEGGAVRAIVRFARGGQADRLWNMVAAGMPLSLSMGTRIRHAERVKDLEEGGGLYEVTQWSLEELSVCVFGRDTAAVVRSFCDDEHPDETLARMVGGQADSSRAAVRHALHLSRWTSWATRAGIDLASRLGTCPGDTAAALETAVKQHCDALELGLAA